jgi:hypothetical protein
VWGDLLDHRVEFGSRERQSQRVGADDLTLAARGRDQAMADPLLDLPA